MSVNKIKHITNYNYKTYRVQHKLPRPNLS